MKSLNSTLPRLCALVLLLAALGQSLKLAAAPVARWNLGEQDSDAVSGSATAATTVDALAGYTVTCDLTKFGTSHYTNDVPSGTGSTLAMNFYAGGAFTNLNCPAITNLDQNNFSIAFDAKPQKGSSTYATAVCLSRYGRYSPFIYVDVKNATGTSTKWTYAVNGQAGATIVGYGPGTNKWQHIELARVAGTNYLYINGALAGTTATTFAGTFFPMFSIGVPVNATMTFDTGGYFNGSLDNVVLENTFGRILIGSGPTLAPPTPVAGGSFSLSISASSPSAPALTYAWRKNGTPISPATNPTATNATVSFSNTTTNDSGNYDVVITNLYYSVTSTVASVTISMPRNGVVWTGAASSEWSLNAIGGGKNWQTNGVVTDFRSYDNVQFDDSTANTTVDVSVADVVPFATTFTNSSKDFVLQGSKAVANGTLTKSGTGTLTISNVNSYTVGTFINGGTLAFASGGLGSAGTIAFGGSSTLRWLDGNAQDLSSRLAPFSSGFTTTLDVGTNGITFSSALSGSGAIVKGGSGTLSLTGTSPLFTGDMNINAGVLELNNLATCNSAITVNTNAVLQTGGGPLTLAKPLTFLGTNGTLRVNGSSAQVVTLAGGLYGTNLVLNLYTPAAGGYGGATFNATGGFSGLLNVVGLGATGIINVNSNASQTALANVEVTLGAGIVAQLGNGGVGLTQQMKSLNGSGTVQSDSRVSTLLLGANSGAGAFRGILKDGAGTGPRLALIKAGGGTQTLSGFNTYTGPTSINAGTLVLDSGGQIAFGSSVTVASNATLAVTGSGSLASATNLINPGGLLDLSGATPAFSLGYSQILIAGRTGAPGTDISGELDLGGGNLDVAGTGKAATLTLNTNLSLSNGGGLNLDLSSNPASGNDIIVATGVVTLPSAYTTVMVNPLNGYLGAGTYTLISGSSVLGDVFNLNLTGLSVSDRQTMYLTNTGTALQLVVVGAVGDLRWTAQNGTSWDHSVTNWFNRNSLAAENFHDSDFITFDDSAAATDVNVAESVSPAGILVSNVTSAYTFGGTAALGGSGGLTKDGSGLLTIAGLYNLYTGPTALKQGVLAFSYGALGTGPVVFAGPGTLRWLQDNIQDLSPQFAALANGNSATLDLGNNGITFAAPIAGAGGVTTLGAGSLTLTANNSSFNGDLNINNATLAVYGAKLAANPANTTLGAAGPTNHIYVHSGATLQFLQSDQLGSALTANQRQLTIAGGTVLGSGVLTTLGDIVLSGGTMTADGGVINGLVNSGTFQLNGTITVTGAGASVMNDTGLSLNARYLLNRNGSTTVFNVGVVATNASADLTISTPLANNWAGTAVGLTKLGAGTLLLSAANLYTGATTVSNGVLLVNGGLDPGSAVYVAPGGTLGGNGTIGGPLTLDGTVSPGRGVGTLTTSNQTWNGGAAYLFQLSSALNSAEWDLLEIAGTLDIQASAAQRFTVKLASMSDPVTPGRLPDFDGTNSYAWTIARVSGGILNFDPAKFVVDTSGFSNAHPGTFSVGTNDTSLVLNYTLRQLTPPVLSAYGPLSGGAFPLTFSGPSGQTYKVLTSANVALPLSSWIQLTAGTFGSTSVTYTDTSATNRAQFYRITSP
jgi:autotransporter-associated beta strand protein